MCDCNFVLVGRVEWLQWLIIYLEKPMFHFSSSQRRCCTQQTPVASNLIDNVIDRCFCVCFPKGFTITESSYSQPQFSAVQQLQDSSTLESQALSSSYHPPNLLHVSSAEVVSEGPPVQLRSPGALVADSGSRFVLQTLAVSALCGVMTLGVCGLSCGWWW